MRVRIGVIEMGRKSECWVGMAILGTGVMLASFHCCATVDVAGDMLNRNNKSYVNLEVAANEKSRNLPGSARVRALKMREME